MTDDAAQLTVRLRAATADFENKIKRAERVMRENSRKIGRQAEGVDKRLRRVGGDFAVGFATRVGAAAAALVGFNNTVGAVVRNGDRLRRIEGRFEALTGSAARAGDALDAVKDISRDTGAGLESVAGALSQFTIAASELGRSDAEVQALVETFVKLGQIGGSSATELDNAIRQFGQGLAGGIVRAEEFNSVLENTPLVAQEIADGLGLSIGQLRELVLAGELTADRVFEALLSKTDEVRDKFAELPPDLERQSRRLASAWAVFTGELDRSLGVSEKLAASLEFGIDTLRVLQQGLTEAQISGGRVLQGEAGAQALRDFGIGTGVRPERSATSAAPITPIVVDPIEVTASRPAPSAPSSPSRRRGGGGRRVPSFEEILAPTRREIDRLGVDAEAAGLDERAARVLRREYEILADVVKEYGENLEAAVAAGRLPPDFRAQISEVSEEYAAQVAEIDRLTAAKEREAQATENALREAERAAEAQSRAWEAVGDSLAAAIRGAESFEEALKRVGVELAVIAARGLTGQGPAAGIFENLLGVGSGQLGNLVGANIGSLFRAPAAPVTAPVPSVRPFAKGGVVNEPTVFPFAKGTGLMGEAGPEAILPLRRGADGRLGVEASGGSGGGSMVVNINVAGDVGEENLKAIQRAVAGLAQRVPEIAADGIARSPRLRGAIR